MRGLGMFVQKFTSFWSFFNFWWSLQCRVVKKMRAIFERIIGMGTHDCPFVGLFGCAPSMTWQQSYLLAEISTHAFLKSQSKSLKSFTST